MHNQSVSWQYYKILMSKVILNAVSRVPAVENHGQADDESLIKDGRGGLVGFSFLLLGLETRQ